jgi:two-component system OmpR family response regulator
LNTSTEPKVPTLAICDDDAEICVLLQRYFTEHGFNAHTVPNGIALHRLLAEQEIDLVILDLMLPGDDGFAVCRTIRTSGNVPVIMLTASNEETDRIIGLELGADDYVAKPFNARELLARVRAVLRRHQGKSPTRKAEPKRRHFGNWSLDCLSRCLLHGERQIALGGPEYRLLNIFLDQPNAVISRDALSRAARHREYVPYDRTIDIQVSKLRQLLREEHTGQELIRTLRGEGYMLLAEVVDET